MLFDPAGVATASQVKAPATVPVERVDVDDLFHAVSLCRRALPKAERWQIATAIDEESARYGFDPLFVLAIAEVESTCQPTARGPGGSVGLIQLMPATAKALASEAGVRWRGIETLTHPASNVRIGLHYLNKLEGMFDDPYVAMTAYNMGPERAARLPRQRARSSGFVRRILSRYERLLGRYGPEGT